MNPMPAPADDYRLIRRDWLWALGAALVAMLVRLPGCFKGFWIDEFYTMRAAHLDALRLIGERMQVGHFPAYFLYAKLGLLLGQHEWMMRLTSLLPLGLTVLLLTGLVGALGLKRYLPTAWVLAIFHPYWVTVSVEYRYMMLVVAATVATAWVSVAYARRPTLGRIALLVVVSIIMLSIHPICLIGVLALLGFLVADQVNRHGGWSTRVFSHPLPLLVSLLFITPLMWFLRHSRMLSRPPCLPEWGKRYDNLLEVTFGGTFLWDRWLEYYHISFNRDLMPVLMSVVLVGSAWAARRRLLDEGRTRAWRLLVSLLVIYPVVYLLFSTLVADIQGSGRYWCILSVPTFLLLMLGWHAPLSSRQRWVWRGVFVGVLGLQFIVTSLDRGDLQREAAQWILRNHHADDRVLVARGEAYLDIFNYLGFTDWDRMGVLQTADRQLAAIVDDLRGQLIDHPRALMLLYRPKVRMAKALSQAQSQGVIADWKIWRLNNQTSVAAVARDPSGLPWLCALPELKRPWGPSRGDD